MKGGNSATVAAGRIECRRIGDGVDRTDQEQQANQTYGILEFQSALEQEEPNPPAGIPFHKNNIILSVEGCTELYHNRINSGFRPISVFLRN